MEFPSYKELLEEKGEDLGYGALLCTKEWRDLRSRIIERDGNKCTSCGTPPTTYKKDRGEHWRDFTPEEIKEQKVLAKAKEEELKKEDDLGIVPEVGVPIGGPVDDPVFLHVHHKYYVFRNLPWEYEEKALVTMCHHCHYKLHEEKTVPVYTDDTLKETMDFTPCSRCTGTGYFPEYKHIQGGTCFRCSGARYEELIGV